MRGYTGEAINGYSILTPSDDESLSTGVSIGAVKGKRIVDAGLIVRMSGDRLILEKDVNDKLLIDALTANGVPCDRVALACGVGLRWRVRFRHELTLGCTHSSAANANALR